ncbi:MAG: divergent PAP2 family protein [Vampirovibrionales bacterium]
MDFWSTIYNNGYEVMIAGFSGAFLAQFFKVIGHFLRYRVLNYRLLVETGGMPSSHSASMTSMAINVGMISGFSSTIFAVAASLALVVMYDAAGVRRAAGRMAGVLNQLTEDIWHQHPSRVPVRLRELLGHTPFEVLIGGLLGALLGVGWHWLVLTMCYKCHVHEWG